MTNRLYIDCGAADTRAARLVQEEIVEFWFGPALGDENLPRLPEFGDLFLGRIRTIAPGLRGAFVDIGDCRDALLSLGPGEKAPREGETLVLKVRRPPLSEKGAVLTQDWQAGLAEEELAAIEASARSKAPGLLNFAGAGSLALRAFAGKALARVEINSTEAAAGLLAARVLVRDDPDTASGMDAALEASLERTAGIAGGARLVFDETEGGAVVDVDGGAIAETGPNARDRVNAAAARVLFQELSRRGIVGRIVIDFLPIPNRKARAAFLQALTHGPKDGYECRVGNLSADGLLDLTAPRRRRSLLEQASELDNTLPRSGRAFTRDWNAKAAIRRLESLLKRQPKARPRLLVGSSIGHYLERERPQWTMRLQAKYGARFIVSTDEKLETRAFDLAE